MRRKLALGWLNGLDLFTSVTGTAFVVLLSRAYPTPMSLVVGNVFGALVGAAYALGMPAFRLRAIMEETLGNRFDHLAGMAQQVGRGPILGRA